MKTNKPTNTGPGKTGPVSRPKHRLSNIDEAARAALCSVCGPATPLARVKDGNWRCRIAKQRYNSVLDSVRWRLEHPIPRHQHVLVNLDEVFRTAECAACGPTEIVAQTNKAGNFKWRCWRQRVGANDYRVAKTDTCEWCARRFHRCQMDIDHVDNNHANNLPENLMSLCSNCHRLKTWMVAVGVPESRWLELREQYGAVLNPPIIDVSKKSRPSLLE